MSELKKPIENSLESLSMTIPFSCRDWGQEKRDAWVYGIVCGWDDDCRAGFKKKFGWNAETFDRLKRLHAHFEEVRRAQPENEPLTCEGCVDKGQYENEVEYGYPSPCTRCKRRSPDNYRRKPERSE